MYVSSAYDTVNHDIWLATKNGSFWVPAQRKEGFHPGRSVFYINVMVSEQFILIREYAYVKCYAWVLWNSQSSLAKLPMSLIRKESCGMPMSVITMLTVFFTLTIVSPWNDGTVTQTTTILSVS